MRSWSRCRLSYHYVLNSPELPTVWDAPVFCGSVAFSNLSPFCLLNVNFVTQTVFKQECRGLSWPVYQRVILILLKG